MASCLPNTIEPFVSIWSDAAPVGLSYQRHVSRHCKECRSPNTLSNTLNYQWNDQAHVFSSPCERHGLIGRRSKSMMSQRLCVYCSNATCSVFLPRDQFEEKSYSTIARCSSCDIITCVGCKSVWEGYDHECDFENSGTRPPAYSPDCRIKKCPYCKLVS